MGLSAQSHGLPTGSDEAHRASPDIVINQSAASGNQEQPSFLDAANSCAPVPIRKRMEPCVILFSARGLRQPRETLSSSGLAPSRST
eukprot:12770061-Heterocapsa_arctica.AAC.1